MKKRGMMVLSVVVLIALALMGCGSKSGGASKASAIVGKWTASTVEAGGVSVDYKTYADQLKATGTDTTMELDAKEDGKLSINMMGQSADGTWKEDGDKYVLTIADEDQEVSVADGKLTFDYADMGIKIVFEK